VREVPLDIADVVFAPIATAQFVLNRQVKQAGALLIDMGAGTTDYVLYQDGQLVASGCVPLGGDHISNDITLMTGIPLAQAELLKKTEGDANSFSGKTNEMVRVRGEGHMKDAAIERNVLNEIIRSRLLEIFNLVKSSLPKDTFKGNRCHGVYLCGGASLMRGVGELASHVFGVAISRPTLVKNGAPSYLDDPRYCTAIGLIRYAQILDAELPQQRSWLGRMLGFFGKKTS